MRANVRWYLFISNSNRAMGPFYSSVSEDWRQFFLRTILFGFDSPQIHVF